METNTPNPTTYPISMHHPDGSTIHAAADYGHAIVYVAHDDDIQHFRPWLTDRMALRDNHTRRADTGIRSLTWQILVDPTAAIPTPNPLATLMEHITA